MYCFMTKFKVGDRVRPKQFYPGKGVGIVTTIRTERNLSSGLTYLQYEVEYDNPIDGEWPYLSNKRHRGYFCSEALERV